MNEIAILLTSYNGEKYIGELLYSLEGQTDTRFDLYIRDDGSSDETITVIETFLSHSSFPVTLLPQGENLGAAQNFAALLQYTLKKKQYRYFMFCDQDDVWLPEKVEETYKAMQKTESLNPDTPILIHTDLQVTDEKLNLLHPSYWAYQHIDPNYDSLNRLLIQNVITGCTAMINHPLAKITNEIPKTVIMHDWWIGLAAAAFGRIEALPLSGVSYRQHDKNDTGATAYNLAAITARAFSLFSFSFDKYTRQARSFLKVFGDRLDEEQKELLEAFISIENSSWLKGKMTLAKYRFLKQHWMRNIGLFLCK